MQSDQSLYHELSYYTLAHGDPVFIYQLVVDAYTAQHADATTKPIALVFALVGLYLHLERGYTTSKYKGLTCNLQDDGSNGLGHRCGTAGAQSLSPT